MAAILYHMTFKLLGQIRGGCPRVIECHSYVTCAAKSIVFLNLSSTYLQPTGRGDGALQVLVAGLWQGL